MKSEFVRTFAMEWLLGAIGKSPDHIVRGHAMAWFDKGVLTEEDLAEIKTIFDAKNKEAEYIEEQR